MVAISTVFYSTHLSAINKAIKSTNDSAIIAAIAIAIVATIVASD